MNVTELARQLKMTKDQLFDKIMSLGFDVGRRAIKIDDAQADKIIEAVRSEGQASTHPTITQRLSAEPKAITPAETQSVITLPSIITIKDFADRLQLPITKVMGELMRNGIMSSLNEQIDYDTASIIAEDLGMTTTRMDEQPAEEKSVLQRAQTKLAAVLDQEQKGMTQDRPPVVVVMGHVDHGKTTLLDQIRESNVAAKEQGGITQKIGAYQVTVRDRSITFIDTPGHEAFSAMRDRGANVADIAILVIAADDGIRPQTEEALSMIQTAQLPFIVAINKIDRPGADIERIKKQLSEWNLIPEDWGGKTIVAPLSAKTRKGLPELLDMILLVADMEKAQMKANPDGRCVGTIIESHVDSGKGPVATILIQNGTLRLGDLILGGSSTGKVRSLYDFRGQPLSAAPPSTPAQILGFKSLPMVGDLLEVTTEQDRQRQRQTDSRTLRPSSPILRSATDAIAAPDAKTLSIIIKADTLGSLEALHASILHMVHVEVQPKIVHQGLGNITERDVAQALDDQTLILGFDIHALPGATDLAKKKKLRIVTSSIIYDLLKTVKEALESMLSKESILTKVGEAKVLKRFRQKGKTAIVGVRVTSGSIKQKCSLRVMRQDHVIGEGVVEEVQRDKKRIPELPNGVEGGIQISIGAPVEENDIIEIYEETLKIKPIDPSGA